MGIMGVWVMHDLYHQPYFSPGCSTFGIVVRGPIVHKKPKQHLTMRPMPQKIVLTLEGKPECFQLPYAPSEAFLFLKREN